MQLKSKFYCLDTQTWHYISPLFFVQGGDDHFVVTSDPGQAVSAQKFLLPYDLPVAAYEKKGQITLGFFL